MEDKDKKLIEKLESDFHTLSEKNAWTPEDLEKMKNLQKLMYYMEVRCAMKEGADYPGQQYMEDRNMWGHSYMPHRSPMTGRYTSGSYMPSRRYYDSEHEKFMNDLHRMASMEGDPEIRTAMENVARMLEMR